MAKDRWLTTRKPGDLIPRTGAPVTRPTASSPIGTGVPPRSDVLQISPQVGTIPAGGIADLPEQKLLELYRGEFSPDTELLRTQHGTPAVFEAEGEEYPEGRLRGPFAQELLGVERTRPGGAMISEGIYSGEEFKVGEEYFKVYGEKALYEMEVPKSLVEGTFLDWDAPINEQPEGMEERMMSFLRGIHPDAVKELHRTTDDPTGAQVFRMGEKYLRDPSDTPYSLAFGDSGFSPKLEATRRLQAQGIPGLRFLDERSRESNPEWSYEVSLGGEIYDSEDPDSHSYISSGDRRYQNALQRITLEVWERDQFNHPVVQQRLAENPDQFNMSEWKTRPPVERSSLGTDLTGSSKESVVKEVLKNARKQYSSGQHYGSLLALADEIVALEDLLEDVGALEIRDKPRTRNHVVWDQRLLDQISRSTLTRKKATGGFIDKPLYERTL